MSLYALDYMPTLPHLTQETTQGDIYFAFCSFLSPRVVSSGRVVSTRTQVIRDRFYLSCALVITGGGFSLGGLYREG